MPISERAEEILETLWGRTVETKKGPADLGLAQTDPAIEELRGLGFIRVDQAKITLTSKGNSEGEKVVRRHRLAERLFADVLDVRKDLVHPVSCKFEHLLHGGIEDNICILLGHPTTCPHGRPIPPGECCRKHGENAGKVVSALSAMKEKQKRKSGVYSDQGSWKASKTDGHGRVAGYEH